MRHACWPCRGAVPGFLLSQGALNREAGRENGMNEGRSNSGVICLIYGFVGRDRMSVDPYKFVAIYFVVSTQKNVSENDVLSMRKYCIC